MRCPPRSANKILLSGAVLSACVQLVACGDWCFSGVINNPNGVIITTKNASPPPACPPSPIISTMNVAVVKSQPCLACTPSIRANHIFVTLTAVQLHSASSGSSNDPEWVDLAPQLHVHPYEMDLLGDLTPLVPVNNAPIAPGTYREVRLQFAPDASTGSDEGLATEASCGHNRANCLLLANGGREQLYFTADPPELLVPLQINGSNSLAVVPGAKLDLELTLQLQQVSFTSTLLGWQAHFTLVGRASILR